MENNSFKIDQPIIVFGYAFPHKKTYDFSSYASGLYHVVIKTAHTEKHHKLIYGLFDLF